MADDPTQDPPAPEPPADPPKDPPKDPELGDAGKKALDAERKRAAAAEKKAKQLEAELEAARLESASDQEKALAAAKAEGSSEATAKANTRIIRSEVKAMAAKKLNDPSDAVSLLDLSSFEVDADGNVDEQAISTAIDELVNAKPYLAAGATPAATGNGDGGAHDPPPNLSLQQQIAEAEGKGDWALSKNLKSQQLMALRNNS